MRATSGKSLFTETLHVAQIIRYVIVSGIARDLSPSKREEREMVERNVVRTAEVYRAYSGIAAATVSGVLRMSPMAHDRRRRRGRRERDVSCVDGRARARDSWPVLTCSESSCESSESRSDLFGPVRTCSDLF